MEEYHDLMFKYQDICKCYEALGDENEMLKRQNSLLRDLLENARETLKKILHSFDEEIK